MADADEFFDHVVVGAGVAAARAATGIRSVDPNASILLLGAEPDPPLYRPDLSKTLWFKPDAVLADSFLDVGDAELRLETEVVSLDTADHSVRLADGTVIRYGALLLATGAEPRTTDLPPGPRVVHYRTAADLRALKDLVEPDTSVVVVGGGYIGGEMAAALVSNGAQVTMVLDVEYVQETIFPPRLARAVTADFGARGVRMVHGLVTGGEVTDSGVTVRTDDGTEITADVAVVGIGVVPRTKLAEEAGIELDDERGGILVDEHLRTSAPDVWAAGDVASYPDVRLGRRRVEHVDAAEKMGTAAGRAMAGADEPFEHTPFFWSDLFDFGYEAVGVTSTRLETVEDFVDDGTETGVVYYLDGGRVRGVLLWNVWDSVPNARALIEETATEPLDDPDSVRGRIPLG